MLRLGGGPEAGAKEEDTVRSAPVLLAALALLALLIGVHSLLPEGPAGPFGVLVGLGALGIGLAGLLLHRPTRRRGWLLILTGVGLWVLGDLVRTLETPVPGDYPAASDLISLAAYPLLGLGVLDFSRARGAGRDHGAVLDALIITTSIGVVLGTLVIAPLADSSTLPLTAKAIGAAYPLGDLFLLGVLARLYAVPGARNLSYFLLVAGIGLTLTADVGYEVSTLIVSNLDTSPLIVAAALGGYLLVGAAACATSMRVLADPDPATQPEDRLSRPRQAALVLALLLPNIALLVDGYTSQARHWAVIAVGMLLIGVLILVRILWLIYTVQSLANELREQARADGLTGAPNRRTWDWELARATAMAREHGTALCVAMIDLDKFKVFNDTRGHQAGDLLLRDSVAAWSAQLRPPAMLARYGGEEFALLAPGFSPLQLATVLERLREVTPYEQTFSAGVAQWDPMTDPGSALAAADEALYAAKRAGRNRVVIAGDEPPLGPPTGPVDLTSINVKAEPIRPTDESKTPLASRRGRRRVIRMPEFSMVTQPIVDLRAQQVCAHEALARFAFPGTFPDTSEVFRQAYREGFGDLLELAAIRAALDLPDRPREHDLYVNASARALMTARMRTGLPDDLSGVVIELSEDPGDVDMGDLLRVVNDLRDRGAGIALDDVGAGALEFARLAMLQPDMVKIDRSLVVGCATDNGRTAVLKGLVSYAESLGVMLCAEGPETLADLGRLAALGVTHAQGNIFSPAKPGWHRVLTPVPGFTMPPVRVVEPTGPPEPTWTYRPPGYDDPDSTSPIMIQLDPEN